MALAASFASNIDVNKVVTNDWYDLETNEVIPLEELGWWWLKQSDQNGGDKDAATRATEHKIPGGKIKLFDTLSRDKCLANVRIIGPPLILTGMSERDKNAEYHHHQMAVHDVIVWLAPGLEGLIFDLFTSRAELTDLGFPASITYVRFPYYLGTSVVSLCGELNMAHIGPHALKAEWHTRSSLFVGIDAAAWTH